MSSKSRSGRRARQFRPSPSSRRGRALRPSAWFCPALFRRGTRTPIYARVNGYLKDWYFDYGAHVKKGDLLAEDPRPAIPRRAIAAATQAKLNSARRHGAEGEGSRKAIRRDHLRTLAGLPCPRVSSRCRNRRVSRPTTTAPWRALNAAIAEVAADQGEVDRLKGAGRIQEDHRALRRRRHRARNRYRRPHRTRWQRHRRRQRPGAVPRGGYS